MNDDRSKNSPKYPSSSSAGAPRESTTTVIVTCKTTNLTAHLTPPTQTDAQRAYAALTTYAFPGRTGLDYLFAFEGKKGGATLASGLGLADSPSAEGPPLYSAATEFDRQKLFAVRKSALVSGGKATPSPYRLSTANADFSICSSYPAAFVVPSRITDKTLKLCGAFRSEGRIPILSWGNSADAGSIWRCSQPKVGLGGNQNAADEAVLKCIGEAANGSQPGASSSTIYPPEYLYSMSGDHSLQEIVNHCTASVRIFDLRPKTAAVANRATGGGYESPAHYQTSVLNFYNIENIHAVRNSLAKLMTVCQSPTVHDVNFSSIVEDTRWLHHAKSILSASWTLAFVVSHRKIPTLVHCSHGWDRTSQVCGLAQLFLDPYYRTYDGFRVLVEKEWLSFGHPFQLRCAHGEAKADRNDDQMSPIFLQFLDCVFQLVNTFPSHFEYNSRYLMVIATHIYSCRFGTFLYNTEKERTAAQVHDRCLSLWDYLQTYKEFLVSPFYKPACLTNLKFGTEESLFLPPLSIILRKVALWQDLYLRGSPKESYSAIPRYLKGYVYGGAGKLTRASVESEDTEDGGGADQSDVAIIDADIRACVRCKDDEIDAWFNAAKGEIGGLLDDVKRKDMQRKMQRELSMGTRGEKSTSVFLEDDSESGRDSAGADGDGEVARLRKRVEELEAELGRVKLAD